MRVGRVATEHCYLLATIVVGTKFSGGLLIIAILVAFKLVCATLMVEELLLCHAMALHIMAPHQRIVGTNKKVTTDHLCF